MIHGEEIKLRIFNINRHYVSIGIEAEKNVTVDREEIYAKKFPEYKK